MTEECLNDGEPPKEDFNIGGTWASSNLMDPKRPPHQVEKEEEQVWNDE